MYGEFTHPKLMAVGMEFVNHMCNNASDENLKPRSPVLLNGMVKLMEGAVEPEVSDFINVALQREVRVRNVVYEIEWVLSW